MEFQTTFRVELVATDITIMPQAKPLEKGGYIFHPASIWKRASPVRG
jgi:hypothetical protein